MVIAIVMVFDQVVGGLSDAVFCSKVESIEDTRQKNGKTQFRIRWKGYGPDTDTWENEEDLSCPSIIRAFLEKNKNEGKAKKRAGKAADSSVSKKTKNEAREGNVEDDEEDESKEYEVSIQYEGRFVGERVQSFITFFTTCTPTIYTISSGNIS
jgi:hypothetical protein